MRSKKTADDLDPDLLEHVRSLGLATVEEYRRWCREHGFGRRTDKDWRERSKERFFATAERARVRLARLRGETRNPAETLRRIAAGEFAPADLTQPRFVKAAEAFARLDGEGERRAYLRLLLHVLARRADLLSADPVVPQFGDRPGNGRVEALAAVARRSGGWLRPPEDWTPATRNTPRQFSVIVSRRKWRVRAATDLAPRPDRRDRPPPGRADRRADLAAHHANFLDAVRGRGVPNADVAPGSAVSWRSTRPPNASPATPRPTGSSAGPAATDAGPCRTG